MKSRDVVVVNDYSWVGGFGSMFAAILSYLTNHSVGYAIVHMLLGWMYVIYNLIAYGFPHFGGK